MEQIKNIMRELYKHVDIAIQNTWKEPNPPKVACFEPCNGECCVTYTSLSPAEALMLYEENLPWDKINHIAKIKNEFKGKNKMPLNRMGVQCVFWEKGKCKVYDNRPLGCRYFFAENRETCKNNSEKYQTVHIHNLMADIVLDSIEPYSVLSYDLVEIEQFCDGNDIHQLLLDIHSIKLQNKPLFVDEPKTYKLLHETLKRLNSQS